MDQHINVTFRLNGASHDLRIPTRMEVRRLIRELDQIFGSSPWSLEASISCGRGK